MSLHPCHFYVVSEDRSVVEHCREAVSTNPCFAGVHHVSRLDDLPQGLNIDDWVLLDLDSVQLPSDKWFTDLSRLGCQVVATGRADRRKQADRRKLQFRRLLEKPSLRSQLQRMLTGPNRPQWAQSLLAAQAKPVKPSSNGLTEEVDLAIGMADFAAGLSKLNEPQITEATLGQLADWFEAKLVSLYGFDEEHNRLLLLGKTHPHAIDQEVDLEAGSRQPMAEVARSRRLVFAENWDKAAASLERSLPARPGETYVTESFVIAPVVVGARLLGVLNMADPARPDGFDPQLLRLVEPICNLIGLALSNARLFRDVQEQARTDGLTGLLNRRTFAIHLQREVLRAKRYESRLSLAMIDMDGLKQINDKHGHLAGDAAIQETSRRIAQTLRTIDIAARYGGDEFAIILPNTSLEQAERVVVRLTQAASSRPCFWNEQEIPIRFSVGVCQLEEDMTPNKLIEAADAALYAAKTQSNASPVALSLD